MDPDYVLQPALIAALNAGNLTLNGKPVPVYSYAPDKAVAPYVLLSQVTTEGISGAMGCTSYQCVYQVTVLTSFSVQGEAKDRPSLDLSGQIRAVLEGVVLPLTDGFTANPLRIRQTRKVAKFNQKQLEILRFISCSVTVHKNR